MQQKSDFSQEKDLVIKHDKCEGFFLENISFGA